MCAALSARERVMVRTAQGELAGAREHGAALQQKLDAAVAAQEQLAQRLEQQRTAATARADDLQVRPATAAPRLA